MTEPSSLDCHYAYWNRGRATLEMGSLLKLGRTSPFDGQQGSTLSVADRLILLSRCPEAQEAPA